MKKRIYNQTSLFGPLYAYLVVLSPPIAIKNNIAQIKRELNAITNISERNLYSIAHITLTDKLTDDVYFAETIEKFVSGYKPFKIKINGWGYFDHGHSITVYLNIEHPQRIIDLMIAVKSTTKTPHITLAKKIPHETFIKLRLYMEKLNYTAEWLCTEVTVLKKLMSEKHLGFKDKVNLPFKY